ncbi:hypothetical protein [Pseudonocardia parietis]|uniref:SH3 domain-containing protein n=1 Tax=Pseudonocardia parietis TaxID=570936 RepID=A0ABS4VXF6_9PSEU|nr:hypothetical protein [Pseudonocardia parietis]MBP2368486.1 hypothetical protein [Pseudonocardia parietis]
MSADPQAAPAAAPPRTVPVAAGTNLRRGVSVLGPANIIGAPLPAGSYTALGQCAGGSVTEGNAVNFWWVKISASTHRDGWVSAVRVLEGGNNEPIAGVAELPTVQA